MNLGISTSIRRRLTMVLLLISSVVLALAMAGFLVNDWFTLRTALFERLNAQASIIGSNSVAALAFQDRASANETLNILHSEESIAAARLFDVDGEHFASYQRGKDVLPEVLPLERSGFRDGQAFVVLPIERDSNRYGSILLVSDFSDWKKRQRLNLLTAGGLLVLSLIAAVLLANWLQRLVSMPIIELARTAREITEKQDYSLRAQRFTEDEIGRLVDDFNGMLKQIQVRDQELHTIQEQLENKVESRTEQLTMLTKQLEYQAYHDPLTGLANRTTFDNHLRMSIEQVDRYGGEIAVLFLDLDRFKVINDTLGHAVGDKLLIEVAQRFSECMRASDTLARLGGDEFAVLMQHLADSAGAADVAHKLSSVIAEPFAIDDHTLHLSTSIGICVYPLDGKSPEAILKNADTAMYCSKALGGNRFSFFSSDMNVRVERRMLLENKLRDAVQNNRFEVNFQPRCDTKSKAIVGVEALVRWTDPEEGVMSPAEFIPVAEECGMIAHIDEWVLERACLEVLDWYDGKSPEIKLAVNISPVQFTRKDLHLVIESILQRTGFPGSQLELEITENLFGADKPEIHQIFEKLVELNIEIGVDDFGTAYSSLSRLKQLPLNTLKIDQSFVRDLGKDVDDEAIVRTIIDMAHNLNLKVVAEGVANELQYRFVKANNCDMVQGYLFGRPAPGGDIKSLLAQAGRVPADRTGGRS